jgi:hypothetical protein
VYVIQVFSELSRKQQRVWFIIIFLFFYFLRGILAIEGSSRETILRVRIELPAPFALPYCAMHPNAGYPTGFPQNQQMPFYPNSIPQYQPNTPQQQPFGAIPMQPGPGGVMMPSGFQQSSGK